MIQTLVNFLEHSPQLKQTARTGWIQRGVNPSESVAGHSYGVAFICMVLAQQIDHPFNMERLLSMAILHDLPEAITTDIPSPVKRFMPKQDGEPIKTQIERNAWREMTENLPFQEAWLALWEDGVQRETAEGKLLKDADQLDMYLQAMRYEQQTGNQRLSQFWEKIPLFYYDLSQQLYEEIRGRRIIN